MCRGTPWAAGQSSTKITFCGWPHGSAECGPARFVPRRSEAAGRRNPVFGAIFVPWPTGASCPSRDFLAGSCAPEKDGRRGRSIRLIDGRAATAGYGPHAARQAFPARVLAAPGANGRCTTPCLGPGCSISAPNPGLAAAFVFAPNPPSHGSPGVGGGGPSFSRRAIPGFPSCPRVLKHDRNFSSIWRARK